MDFKKWVQIAGSERKPMTGASEAGTPDPNQLMQVTLVLRQPSGQKHPAVADLVSRGERVTRDEYASRYGADPADVRKVEAFAAGFGLAVAQTNLAARTMTLTGTCESFAKAFQVKLANYQYQGGSFRGRSGPVNVPEELSQIITSVHGPGQSASSQAAFSPGRSIR